MLPAPPVPLFDTCSTIFNNTLYTFSAAAFQSLPLVKGAQWSQLPMGEPVSGAACVQATPTDGSSPAAFYIVGGTTNSSRDAYKGLQRYMFSDGQWESLSPSTAVTQNRLYHNAVYLNASSSILVYAGTQDGTMQESSQTFTISTIPPYTVLAFDSIAPPAISPLLMQWSPSEAVMIGGSESNRKVMIFSPSSAWMDSKSTLAYPLKSIEAVKAIVLDGNDGSKNLFTFDMTVSPNLVNRTIIIDGDGNPVSNAAPVISKSLAERSNQGKLADWVAQNAKRDNLTAASWPAYNSTLAPTAIRRGYSVAKDQSGLVVISGGSTDGVLCMFNARENCWANATAELTQSVGDGQDSGEPAGTTTGSSPTQTASQSSLASGNDTTSPGNNATTLKLLAAILGSVFGVAVIVLLVLLLLRWRRNRRRYIEAGHQRRASGIPAEEKDPMDFADRGLSFENHTNRFQGHGQQESQGSFSSMAILMGKVGQSQKRGVLGRRNGSSGSDSSSTFNKKYKTAISNPIPQNNVGPSERLSRGDKGVPLGQGASAPAHTPKPRPSAAARRGSTRRSSGWNRYWSGGSALNILGFGSRRTTGYSSGSDRASGSQYSDAGLPTTTTQVSQTSAMVPPLNIGRPTGRMSRVASNSPTIAHTSSGFPLKEGITGQIERPGSSSSVSSYDDHRDTFSSGVPASVTQEHPWTPVDGAVWGRGGEVPNAISTENNYATVFPRSAVPDFSARTTRPNFARSSDHGPPLQQASDMSWLNLGAGERRV